MTGHGNVTDPAFAEKARVAWGQPPEWVACLAAEADRNGLKPAAKRIGTSHSLVSMVIRAKYSGDLGRVEAKVRGALMGEMVMCPVLDEIGRDRCLKEQAMPRTATSALRSRLWHACRAGCPNSRIRVGGDDVA